MNSPVKCLCGQEITVIAPCTLCKNCNRLLLPKGVIGTTRAKGDLREFVFYRMDGSVLGTDKYEPGRKRHPWFG